MFVSSVSLPVKNCANQHNKFAQTDGIKELKFWQFNNGSNINYQSICDNLCLRKNWWYLGKWGYSNTESEIKPKPKLGFEQRLKQGIEPKLELGLDSSLNSEKP